MPRATAPGEPALSDAQRRARGLAGVGFLGLAAATLRWPRAASLPTALSAGWLAASHLVAAAIRYRGCPELGAIPRSFSAAGSRPGAGPGSCSTPDSGSKPRRKEKTEMASPARVDDVRRLVAKGTELVEVLPEAEYGELHLEGARNIPLKSLDAETAAVLDPGRPVIVYCHDAL